MIIFLWLGTVLVLSSFPQSVSGFIGTHPHKRQFLTGSNGHQRQIITSPTESLPHKTSTSISLLSNGDYCDMLSTSRTSSSTSLNLFRRLRRRWKERRQKKQNQPNDEEIVEDFVTKEEEEPNGSTTTSANSVESLLLTDQPDSLITNTQISDDIVQNYDGGSGNFFGGGSSKKGPIEDADLVIVGGGISGLAAAITAAENSRGAGTNKPRIVVVEAKSTFGGRVASVKTDDGYTLDEGFAVFIEEYPEVKKLLDYDALKLKPFLPGALVKLRGRTRLGRVADPLREPADLINSVLSPVGSLIDKAKVLPLVFNVRTKSVEELFAEPEVATSAELTDRWGFSESFISSFLRPFLEGIYLAPLSDQSSRMFSFVFKMFSEGSATLPEGGMQAVTDQLVARAESLGIELVSDCPVSQVSIKENDSESSSYIVNCIGNNPRLETSCLVVATDGAIAQKLISNVPGFESLETLPKQPQLAVGCLYYGFNGNAPVEEPILVLNGVGEGAGTEDYPVNNICFPSVVNKGYAPDGHNLCSVTVLSEAMDMYKDRPEELDFAVRNQLATWFPDITNDIQREWDLKGIFYIPKAQPTQRTGPSPANQNGGRPNNTYRGKELPNGLLVCGDHMATATLNGAVESGVNAGTAASKLVSSSMKSKAAPKAEAVAA